jgi:hypothetical protein
MDFAAARVCIKKMPGACLEIAGSVIQQGKGTMKTKIAILILLMSFVLSSCGQSGSISDNFLEYDSTEFINSNNALLSDLIPVFSVKYPPDWKYSWVGDSGVVGLLIASGDIEAAWLGRDYAGAKLMIIPAPYAGEKLTDMFYTIINGAHTSLEPSTTTSINGQDAAWTEYTDNGNSFIEVVIARTRSAVLIVADYPARKETKFRPLLEAIISTINIK